MNQEIVMKRSMDAGVRLLNEAKSIVIVDDVTRAIATELSVNIRKALKLIEAEFRPDIEVAHKLHKDLLVRLNKVSAPFKQAQLVVDAEIRSEYLERERVRREEERKEQEAAEKECRAQEEARQREVEELIDKGELDEAEEVLDSQVVVTPIVPVAAVEKTTRSGAGSVTVRTDIVVEVVDKRVVLEAIIAGTLPSAIVDINMGAAKRYAKAGELWAMPGFSITETAVLSGRTR